MGELAKWALLLAGMLAIIALIIALPIFDWLSLASGANLSESISIILDFLGGYIQMGKGFCNYLLFPWARPLLSIWLYWIIIRKFSLFLIGLLKSAYCWIFK